jgi:hypothetical protein
VNSPNAVMALCLGAFVLFVLVLLAIDPGDPPD